MQNTRRWLYSASAMLGLFISLFTFVSSPSPTHAATKASPTFEASIIQCNGVNIPQDDAAPSWYPRGSTATAPGGTYGQFQTAQNNVNTTLSTFSSGGLNFPQSTIYRTDAPPTCNSALMATTQGNNTRIQTSWDLSRYFAQPLQAAISNRYISITSCSVKAYIPQGQNNAQQVRYDFWDSQTLASGNLDDKTYRLPPMNDLPWIAWPGGVIDQSAMSGWITLGTNISFQKLGQHSITANNLIVTLNDLDTQPGKAVWATAMQFDCMYSSPPNMPQTLTSTSPCQNGQLAQGWQHQDIGSSSLPGGASCSGNSLVVKGTGTDIADSADQFHYVYRALNGDGTIFVHLANLQRGYMNPSNQDKVGVMIRQSAAASAPNVAMLYSDNRNFVYFQSRAMDASTTLQTTDPSGNPWSFTPSIKLVRQGNTFTGWFSNDGKQWTQESPSIVNMTGPVLIGLAVTPNDSDHRVADIATFDNVMVTQP